MPPSCRWKRTWVAHRIGELAAEGFGFRDFAVLVRNTEVIGDFTAAFDEAGIPYVVNRGKGFYDTREVNDLTHLLRVIANPRDEISLATVLRSPLVGASDEALLGLKTVGDNLGARLMRLAADTAADFDADDFGKLGRFRDRLRDWRARREYVTSTGCCWRPWTIAATARTRAGRPTSKSSWRRRARRRAASRSTSSWRKSRACARPIRASRTRRWTMSPTP